MHISEGILTLPVISTGYLVAGIGVTAGLKKMDEKAVIKTAIFSSAFFVASLIHVPIGPSSSHLILNGLLGILLGWACFPAIFVALFLQAILFQFGGLTTLGINTANMAIPSLICFFLFQQSGLLKKMNPTIVGFAAGFTSVFLSAILLSLSLFFSGNYLLPTAKLCFIANIPIMFIDGIVTAAVLQFLHKIKPEILEI